mmetsp:Transcript_39352/g.61340  ORF Transcript_39352/g.61340 Transcript_39352/m.61340 type:complete len:118 (-) Transcript_39352:62-415(-)
MVFSHLHFNVSDWAHGSGYDMGAMIPLAGQRPNKSRHWVCDVTEWSDGTSYNHCTQPDLRSMHRQQHLVYPQLLPGGFYTNHRAYDGERSSALPLVRGALEPWTKGTPGWKFQQMEY